MRVRPFPQIDRSDKLPWTSLVLPLSSQVFLIFILNLHGFFSFTFVHEHGSSQKAQVLCKDKESELDTIGCSYLPLL